MTDAKTPKYTLQGVLEILTTNYGYTKGDQTLRRDIDKKTRIKRDPNPGRKKPQYSDDDVKAIAMSLHLKRRDYVTEAKELIAEERDLQDEYMQLQNSDNPWPEFVADKTHQPLSRHWQDKFYDLKMQLKVDYLFAVSFSQEATFDEAKLKDDLIQLDFIQDISAMDSDDELLLAKYNEYVDNIHDYRRYTTKN